MNAGRIRLTIRLQGHCKVTCFLTLSKDGGPLDYCDAIGVDSL